MILLFLIDENESKKINDLNEQIYKNNEHISKSYIFIEKYKTNEEYMNIYEKYVIKHNKIHILDFYHIFKLYEENNESNQNHYYKYDYDYDLFYMKIQKLYHDKKYTYLNENKNNENKNNENKNNENNELNNEFKSILYILYAKAQEFTNYTQANIIESYYKSYEICNHNLIGIYELLVKCRLNNNYLLGYKYALHYINKFMPKLINDINGIHYNNFIKNIILKSKYLCKDNLYIYLFYLEFEIIIITLNLGMYDIAYQICNRLLLRPLFNIETNKEMYIFNDEMIKQIQYFQSSCIDHVKNKYIFYNHDKINFINMNIQENNKENSNKENSNKENSNKEKSIIFTITTCKRYDLFEKTMNSFINCTPEDDLKLIKEWLCVDDNSSLEDREKMKSKYPFFTFIWKNSEQKGHIPSMNIIREYVLNSGCTHTLQMEDDWQSVIYFDSLSRGLEIMEDDNTIKQVVYNKNYVQNICISDINLAGGIRKYVKNINKNEEFNKYILHQFIHQNSQEFKDYMVSINNGRTNVNWPYYSLNPSLIDINVYKVCGIFEKITWHFEFDYAVKFLYAGFKTAFFDGIYKLHIGKPLGSTDEKNAYDLNDEIKFVEDENKNEK